MRYAPTKILAVAAISFSIAISDLTAPSAHARTDTPTQTASQIIAELPFNRKEDATVLLSIIESIPDEVLFEGDEATHEWIEERTSWDQKADKWSCAGAIGVLLVTTAVPAAKLLKIKRLIKDLGGAKEAAEIMWKASFRYEKLKAMGGVIGDLVMELVGINEVRKECFS